MDVVGSEIGQKMRSAIKAKLTELGCYVDDELPDYVMVMVANKRTRAQMEDDLQLFLGDNTESFVNWLHQVLKKLQEVTVTPAAQASEKHKESSQSKEKKSKDKKVKDKTKKAESYSLKKSKKKDKDKTSKKVEKKAHKSKKKSKHHDMIRPNIPPLLMNMEKESEPSITDVFAGQILKNHGITIDLQKPEPKVVETKPSIIELKRPIVPIIDPATITSQLEPDDSETASAAAPREEQIQEINKIELKILDLKQKLAEQIDSMSDDEDFLNIRTEAEELMQDFVEDVFQEITQPAPAADTPPIVPKSPIEPISKPVEVPIDPIDIPKDPIETLPQIELKLPKRPVRERLGLRTEGKKMEIVEKNKRIESPERFTPDREPEVRPTKSAKTRLGDFKDSRKTSLSDDTSSEKSDTTSKKLTSKVSVLENRPTRSTCASVVRVRPRPRVNAPASSLLMRAVADAHKSLLNAPAKVDSEPSKVKRALVLPMRRCVDAQKIVIQVPCNDSQTDSHGDEISLGEDIVESDDDKSSRVLSDTECAPPLITKKIENTCYVPSGKETRTSTRRDDSLIVETINIHHTTVDKDKNTQFIVTMDGYHPNAFLAKKLMTEGLLNDDDDIAKVKPKVQTVLKTSEKKILEKPDEIEKKRLSNTSDESDTQVIIKQEEKNKVDNDVRDEVDRKSNIDESDKRKSRDDIGEKRVSQTKVEDNLEPPPVKKRRASPIVFDVEKREKENEKTERVRTESVGSDNHVTVTTITSSNKYDAVPPLSSAERKIVWCRSFPLCRYGSMCAFAHPKCKFAAACTRRNCPYSHSPVARPATAPVLASHVVPAANYKTITSAGLPGMCKYYPNCANPTCHYHHPKPCRFGKACANKMECNFYHNDVPSKWKYPI